MAPAPVPTAIEGTWKIEAGTSDPATIISEVAVAKNYRVTNTSGGGKRVKVQTKKAGGSTWVDGEMLSDGESTDVGVGVGDSVQVVRAGDHP